MNYINPKRLVKYVLVKCKKKLQSMQNHSLCLKRVQFHGIWMLFLYQLYIICTTCARQRGFVGYCLPSERSRVEAERRSRDRAPCKSVLGSNLIGRFALI